MSDLVVLLSGGLDSTVCAEIARQSGHLHSVVSFCYGQANTVQEMAAADRWATRHKVPRRVFTVDVPGVSALDIGAGAHGPRVVPGRNLDGLWSNYTGEPPMVDGRLAPSVAILGRHGKKVAGSTLDGETFKQFPVAA
jgi:hypothetical protein